MAEKPPIVDLYRGLAGLMMREKLGEQTGALEKVTGPFPTDFLVTANAVLLQSNAEKIVKLSTKHDVCAEVMQFVDLNLFNLGDGFKWTGEQVESFVKYWTYLFPKVPMPKSWAWPGEDCYAFHRVPFTPKAGPTPLWDELMSRMSNAEAFQLWFGSLFDQLADRQKYVWLYGGGGDGKGAVLRVLARIFGTAYRAEEVPGAKDKFWSYWLQGKRVVAFGDTNDAGFAATGFFKSLTGGDNVRMEVKGGASFCADLSCMFIFASNERPNLSSERADLRRIILCDFAPITGEPDESYEARLWSEIPAVVERCMRAYGLHGNRPIASDTESIEQWIGTLEDPYEALIEQYMRLWALDPNGLECHQPATRATDMTRFVRAHLKGREATEFIKYLERKHKIKRKRVRLDGGEGGEHRYVGITIRDF